MGGHLRLVESLQGGAPVAKLVQYCKHWPYDIYICTCVSIYINIYICIYIYIFMYIYIYIVNGGYQLKAGGPPDGHHIGPRILMFDVVHARPPLHPDLGGLPTQQRHSDMKHGATAPRRARSW